jgi:hypothetical protein
MRDLCEVFLTYDGKEILGFSPERYQDKLKVYLSKVANREQVEEMERVDQELERIRKVK